MSEKKVQVLTQMNCGKFFSMKQYNIFITDKRLIFSFMTKDDKKETERRLMEKVKGKSFKERLSIIASHGYQLPERYDTMAIEDLINEHTNNFFIPFEDIITIKIKRPKTKDSKGYVKKDYLVIKTEHKKLKVSPVTKDDLIMLHKIIGDQVKVPRIIL